MTPALPKYAELYLGHLSKALSDDDAAALAAEFGPQVTEAKTGPLSGALLEWQDWLSLHFPRVTRSPFAERHVRLWERFEALESGKRPRPHVEIWGRGGAKSTTIQLCCVRSCVKLSRRFVLYVSGTQDQANKHLASISRWLEQLDVRRDENRYGASRGWNMQELRTANGWNAVSLGLDTAIRGVKLEELRPDLVIFDDLDAQDDSPKRTTDKIEVLTRGIIPTGSADVAYFAVQNLIIEDGIFSQLYDGRADWLADREVHLEPAAYDLEIESKYDEAIGKKRWYVTKGVPTWEGQDLKKIEEQVLSWGKRAFLIEAQHEVRGAQGLVFNVDQLQTVEQAQVPKGARRCEAWDFAGTEGGGDYTARVRMSMIGTYPTVSAYIEEVELGQWGSDRVRNRLKNSAVRMPSGCMLRIPRDPGQAGMFQEAQLRRDLRAHAPRIRPVSGSKATRARGLAECVNLGNCHLVRGSWMEAIVEGTNLTALEFLLDQLRKFTEDDTHENDDCVDAGSDSFNELALYPDPTPEEKVRDRDAHLPFALRSIPRELGGYGDGLGIEEGQEVRLTREAQVLTEW